MPDQSTSVPPQPGQDAGDERDPLVALLGDLGELSVYLHQRGQQTYDNAQKFADNARKHPETRAYDERQATMLEYQHYIWNEIAGLLDRLIARYGEAPTSAAESGDGG